MKKILFLGALFLMLGSSCWARTITCNVSATGSSSDTDMDFRGYVQIKVGDIWITSSNRNSQAAMQTASALQNGAYQEVSDNMNTAYTNAPAFTNKTFTVADDKEIQIRATVGKLNTTNNVVRLYKTTSLTIFTAGTSDITITIAINLSIPIGSSITLD